MKDDFTNEVPRGDHELRQTEDATVKYKHDF